MSPAKKNKHVDHRSEDTFGASDLYANYIAPPLTDASMFLKPYKLPRATKPLDRQVKLLGAIGDSDWSRSHRVQKSKDPSASVK